MGMTQILKRREGRLRRGLLPRALSRLQRSGGRLAIAALLAAPMAANAVDFAYQANAAVGHTDNISRTAANETDETIASAGLQFSLGQFGPRLQADLTGNFAYYDYLDDTYDPELMGSFAGNVLLNFVPERFTWMIADNFGQVLSDPFQPATPDNREDINYLMTGPDLMFALGSQTRLRLGARYALTTYETRPFDSTSTSGEIQISRMLSSASSVSLNARAQQTEYDESALNADYDRNEAFLQYSATGARTILTIDAGYTELKREADSSSDSGMLLRVDVSRRLSASSSASLSLGREFSSAGEVFAQGQNASIRDLQATPGRQTTDPFINEYVGLGWDFARNRTRFSLHASRSERTYEDNPQLDEKLLSLRAEFGRQLSSVMDVNVHSTFVRNTFEESGRDYDELSLGAGVSWRLSRNVSISMSYDYHDRSSDDALGDYDENRFWFSIGYAHGEPRERPVQPTYAVDAVSPGT
jgi:opacity protein-like surface antigen